jgi:peptidoglycan hydrolase-like protein with peptidoglycan-binding domain
LRPAARGVAWRLAAVAAACVLASALVGIPAFASARPHIRRGELVREAFDGTAAAIENRAVWIWDLSRSDRGNATAIADQARAAGVRSVFIKAADGATRLTQFSPALVGELRSEGLYVCAWQYVYGARPAAEAAAAGAAVRDGAQCLIIDAENQYQGRYWAAQTYMRDLRAEVGYEYPLALASFPYVFLHPSFPYSVFLGPGGAQFDLPQMYWQSIGASIDAVFANTFVFNRIYGRTIIPVGETSGPPTPSEVIRFRDLTVAYGAPGVSWWDWAWTSAANMWEPLSALLTTPDHFDGPDALWPILSEGSRGDDVLWLQEHLARAIPWQRTTGLFAAQTLADLKAFQAQHGLTVTGRTDPATWEALLALAPVTIIWPPPGSHTPTRGSRAAVVRR